MNDRVEQKKKAVGDLFEQIANGSIQIRVKPGEIWQLGKHRLCCGSSLDEQTIKRLLGNVQPGLIWSDPPYGIKAQHKDGRVGGGSRGRISGIAGKAKPLNVEARRYPVIVGDTNTDTAIAAFNLCQRLFPKAAQIWWGANHYQSGLPSSPCWIVWDKLNGASFFADCELAWTNQKTAVRKFSWKWNGMIKQGMAASEKRVHPNQKPVEMVEWAWSKYSQSLICFDPFLGSGTSIIAAERLSENHIVYGCELMPEYCEVILRRWEAFTGEKPLLVGMIEA